MDATRTLAVVLVVIALVGIATWAMWRYQARDAGYGVHPPVPAAPEGTAGPATP